MQNSKSLYIWLILLAVAGTLIFLITKKDKEVTVVETETPVRTSTTSATPQEGKETVSNFKRYDAPPAMALKSGVDYSVLMKTSEGDMKIDLFETDTPIAVNNFVFLSNEGFYDETKFHRIISGFMIQGGDPLGNGTGGPGYKFADEAITKEYKRGTLAMANSGPNTNGSQFFIMHKDYPLPKNYVIFGQVTEGLEVVDKIASTPVSANAFGEKSSPTKEVLINSIEVLEN